jgi:hypothetical protein
MIDYALTSLQPVAPVTVTHGGLLNAPVTDWLTWGIFLIAFCALPLMSSQFRESAIALFAPIRRFLRALHAPLAVGWWGWMVLYVLAPFRVFENIALDFLWKTIGREQLRRLAFPGYMEPILT